MPSYFYNLINNENRGLFPIMQVKILLIVVLCLGIIAGYYLLRGENANAPSGAPEIARRYKDNPDDTLARLQQRLAQSEQEQVWLAERVAALEAVMGKPGTFPDIGTGMP